MPVLWLLWRLIPLLVPQTSPLQSSCGQLDMCLFGHTCHLNHHLHRHHHHRRRDHHRYHRHHHHRQWAAGHVLMFTFASSWNVCWCNKRERVQSLTPFRIETIARMFVKRCSVNLLFHDNCADMDFRNVLLLPLLLDKESQISIRSGSDINCGH